MRSFEEAFSEVYDLIFPPRPQQQAMLAELADRVPVARWLEVACGTGKHALFLARRGMRVTALELDPLMVRRARRAAGRAGLAIDFRQADMTHPESYRDLEGRFGGASCLGNSLAYAVRPGDLELTLEWVGRCLVPGGLFLIQGVNFDLVQGEHTFPAIPVPGVGLVFSRRYEQLAGDLLAFHLELTPTGGGLPRRARHVIRPLSLANLERALGQAGLRVEARWGDFDRRPWTDRAPATVVLATR
ncbi:MAG: methyltransferase domain-containing protein [bacterium]|nr:methyltransferase domain-containing protein [bacterium]